MRQIPFLASLLAQTETDKDFETRYNEAFQVEFPILMGLATAEEIDKMTVDELHYLNYKANKLYKLQHPSLLGEDEF